MFPWQQRMLSSFYFVLLDIIGKPFEQFQSLAFCYKLPKCARILFQRLCGLKFWVLSVCLQRVFINTVTYINCNLSVSQCWKLQLKHKLSELRNSTDIYHRIHIPNMCSSSWHMNCLNFAGKDILVHWTYAYVQKFLWKMLQAFYHDGFLGNIFFPIVSKYSFMISFTQCSHYFIALFY